MGRLVVERLLDRAPAAKVVTVVREPERVEELARLGIGVRRGHYDEPESLAPAFAGAGRLVLISSPELAADRRIGHHRAAIDAAARAGVGAIAYTSFLGADAEATGVTEAHHATEAAIPAAAQPCCRPCPRGARPDRTWPPS